MIEVIDVWFDYGENPVLRGVNFKAKKGEITILMGRNGAGKTTLLMHLNGLLRPKRGKIYVDSVEVKYDKKSLIELRRKVSFVFQNPDDQIIAPTVWQEVAFGPANLGLDNLEEIVRNSLKFVGLVGYERRLCNQLSGGEKKRLSIASAIGMDPEYVIMDEPTAGVDAIGFQSIVEIVEMLRESGKGVIISTHDFDLAKVGDRFVFMDEGRVVYEGDSPDFALASKLGIRTFSSGKVIISSRIPEGVDFVVRIKNGTDCGIEKSIIKAIEGMKVALVCGEEVLDYVMDKIRRYPVSVEVEE